MHIYTHIHIYIYTYIHIYIYTYIHIYIYSYTVRNVHDVPQRPSSAMGTLFLRSINECRLARGDFGALAAGLNLWWMCIYVMYVEWKGKASM
jgi:hypothetical protein